MFCHLFISILTPNHSSFPQLIMANIWGYHLLLFLSVLNKTRIALTFFVQIESLMNPISCHFPHSYVDPSIRGSNVLQILRKLQTLFWYYLISLRSACQIYIWWWYFKYKFICIFLSIIFTIPLHVSWSTTKQFYKFSFFWQFIQRPKC